jgi:probable HAF family extracellular repeat protein
MGRIIVRAFWVILVGFCLNVSRADAQVSFSKINAPGFQVSNVSYDGSVVAGYVSGISPALQAATWTASGGINLLKFANTNNVFSNGIISADGSTYVGYWTSSPGSLERAMRWTSATGIVDFGQPQGTDSVSNAVTPDGSIIVGHYSSLSGSAGFRWSKATGFVTPFPSNVTNGYSLTGISSNGSVVTGIRYPGPVAYIWSSGTGVVDVGDLPGGTTYSTSSAISADGGIVVGESDGTNGHEAFRWTAATGIVGLGTSDGRQSSATGISADGSIIVGTTSVNNNSSGAFIWSQSTGMLDLKTYLLQHGVSSVSAWNLGSAAISGDGRVLVGSGYNTAESSLEYWIATIDAPSFSSQLLGDFNRDGHVNGADISTMLTALVDLNAYKTANGLSDPQLLSIGDVDTDGTITNADLQGLLNRIKSGSGSVDTLPEPSSLALGLVALCAVWVLHFRRTISPPAACARV